jgi:hypothetical protein
VSSAELAGASRSSGAPLLPRVPGHLSGFCWYQAEEEEIRDLFCYTIVKLHFLYTTPHCRPLLSTADESRLERRKTTPYCFG